MVFKRYEIKYQLTSEQRSRLERLMQAHMEPDRFGATTVRNVYYDTPSLLLARRSAEHPYYKEKLRVRSYAPAGMDDQVFLELKKKCDGIVYKRRCEMTFREADALLRGERTPATQIERELAFSASRYEGLAPAMFVAYDREAFYATDDHEFRMTFDTKVRTRTHDMDLTATDEADQILDDWLNLLEVKAGGAIPMWLVSFLSAHGIRKVSFSKVGCAWQRELACQLRDHRPVTAPVRTTRPAVPLLRPRRLSIAG
jgi:hypothetical protein